MIQKLRSFLIETWNKIATGLKLVWTDKDYRLFAIVYLAQGALGLTTVSFPLFLQDKLGLSMIQITTLMASYGILWWIKPFYGFISDILPIFGLRRKPYIFLFSGLSTLSWAAVAFLTPTYEMIFIAMFIQSLGFAFTDVVVDGLAVEKSSQKTAGRIQSIMWGSRTLGFLITGFLGGYLINVIGYQNIFLIVSLLPVAVIASALFVKEDKITGPVRRLSSEPIKKFFKELFKNPWKVIKRIVVNNNALIFASIFIFIVNAFPHFTTGGQAITPFILFMRDSLHFSETTLGLLFTMLGIGKLIGIIVYALFLDGVSLKKILVWSIIVGSAVTMLALVVFTPSMAVVIHLVWGIVGYVSFLPVMKLAVRSCPKGAEATSFATLMSVGNVGNTIAVFSSGYIYTLSGLNMLILLAALGNLLALPFIKFLKEEQEED